MTDVRYSSGYLGHANVPEEHRGWNGLWGTVAVQGPPPRPEGWIDQPRPEEIADAVVVTEWTCPSCNADNDVWGEGAVFSWMTCSECGKDAYLMM